tara:strand:- start:470 stop:706 length:237 start_codon:yes stop_codon:yes gene_type:complete
VDVEGARGEGVKTLDRILLETKVRGQDLAAECVGTDVVLVDVVGGVSHGVFLRGEKGPENVEKECKMHGEWVDDVENG